MNNAGLILVGAGGHARACIDVISHASAYEIAGLIGSPDELGTSVDGCRVIGTDKDLEKFSQLHRNALIAVGQIKSPKVRIELYEKLLGYGFAFPMIISSRAYVSDHAIVNSGTIVMHDALINAGAIVGENCIINSKALIEHDAKVGNHCHISTGVIVNGGASVDEGSFVGSGSVIKEGVSIGKNCLIGIGQIVRHNLQDGSILAGVKS
jgi:sugar O-acyltransferase (sialic acid O-acetyltransferase NeuD family)